jgi:tRNA (guanosine-2'-O-)-methyltransferase
MTPERERRLGEVLSRRQPDLTVLMERVHKWHNFSAILRSCDAVGVLEAHAVIPKHGLPTDPEDADVGANSLAANSLAANSLAANSLAANTNSTSGSAAKWVKVHTHADSASALDRLKARGFRIYAAHFSERAVDYRSVDYTGPTCILLGTERWGVSQEAAGASDGHILIPMLGMVQSLNVSVATAVLLFEAQRQRIEAGLYASPRLDEATRKQVWADWTKGYVG